VKVIKVIEVLNAVGGKLLSGEKGQNFSGVSIDSRKVKQGDLFVALPGVQTDGHLYVDAALNQGASGALISKVISYTGDKALIQVPDTLKALQDLARFHRQKHNVQVIGVTGSNGKTTTKDMIAAVLQEKFSILKTTGNFNNDLGLPLTLLELDSTHQWAVLEMGMRGLGQIKQLVEIAGPTIGVITNIGMAHIEILGSKEKIAQAKGELLVGLPPGGIAILNGEDEYCRRLGNDFAGKKIFYGFNADCDIRAFNITPGDFSASFVVNCPQGNFFVRIPLPGEYNILNALAAVAVGLETGMNTEEIKEGLTKIKLTAMRLERMVGAAGEVIINDTYNANPDSMIAALQTLSNSAGTKKIAILGDMFELGEYSELGHRQVGRTIADLAIDLLITVGEQARYIGLEATAAGFLDTKVQHFSNKMEAAAFLVKEVSKGDIVLVKGSRGMAMEQIVHVLNGR
jgi:UDP-N-acetylmuramoyl-tripeptide--D-alanyl-D-alanine ligase